MVGWETPSPSLDIGNSTILERVLLRYGIYFAGVADTNLMEDLSAERAEGDKNNGEFGTIQAVALHRQAAEKAFNAGKLNLGALLLRLRPDLDAKGNLDAIDSAENRFLAALNSLDVLTARYGGAYSFTAAIAEEGHLPLFGLPVRTVNFIHKDPNAVENTSSMAAYSRWSCNC